MIRFFDIIFATLALILLLPVFIVISILLRFTAEGEVLFLQERIGQNGKTFQLYKFATMLKNSPNMGTGTVTINGDKRILPIGKFLRKSKINELPQLLNIILGQMSVIGPRPLTQQTFDAYPIEVQTTITKVQPGLSGIGSIIFRREEEIMNGANASVEYYNTVIAPYKGQLEEWFVSNRNIIVYFKAIFITICMVLNPISRLPWIAFRQLPEPPETLKKELNYK